MATMNASAVPLQTCLEQGNVPSEPESVTLSIARGRELARLSIEEAVTEIRRRVAAGRLNRGLSLSLPYFDDVALELRHREVAIVPRGRVLFVPAFVVLASEREIEAVCRDRTLGDGTRQHLVEELEQLAAAFRR